ncbi:hypothetical protein HDU88_001010 [Geranomyces variabilis]|nr:hypothetical protein HDU88_001010 [Geranomyces variabilis]
MSAEFAFFLVASLAGFVLKSRTADDEEEFDSPLASSSADSTSSSSSSSYFASPLPKPSDFPASAHSPTLSILRARQEWTHMEGCALTGY